MKGNYNNQMNMLYSAAINADVQNFEELLSNTPFLVSQLDIILSDFIGECYLESDNEGLEEYIDILSDYLAN